MDAFLSLAGSRERDSATLQHRAQVGVDGCYRFALSPLR